MLISFYLLRENGNSLNISAVFESERKRRLMCLFNFAVIDGTLNNIIFLVKINKFIERLNISTNITCYYCYIWPKNRSGIFLIDAISYLYFCRPMKSCMTHCVRL